MTVPGKGGVSSSGAFTYTIPISVPPGTAGMVPKLSLSYSSQGGDGVVGLGWGVGGLSTITRCPQTIAQDTVHGGVNYNSSDRFCLDGQRLILVTGTYGADGAVYRTEIDHFSKIVSHGTAGSGPAWFEVHTPQGLDLQYGNTTSSQILAVGTSTARAWALNQVTDPRGNYYAVTYTNDTTNGQFYPASIAYTGNAAASLSPYNSVQFSYATRTDIVPTYQAGSLIQTTVLLTDIKTYNGSTLVLDYKLAYNAASSAASHDELKSVTLCETGGSCLAPTTFGWQGSRDSPTMSSNTNSATYTSNMQVVFGDFNGDGLTDFAVNATYGCPSEAVYFGSASGTFSASSMTASYDWWTDTGTKNTYSGAACFYSYPQDNPSLAVGDVNGDGFTDIVMDDPDVGSNQTSAVLVNSGSGSLVQGNADNAYQWPFIFSPPSFPSDFDGDGRSDGFLATLNGSIYVYTSNGNGTFTQQSARSVPTTATKFLSGDFDGDGCTDILAQGGGTGQIDFFCQPASASITVPDWAAYQTVVGDFNGDGKSDVLVLTSSGATLYLSTGTGFATGIAIPSSSSWYQYTAYAGDFNGDGKTDLLLVSHTSGTPHIVLLSTGSGFEQLTTIANTSTAATAAVVDLNNDGAQDFLLQGTGADTEYVFAYTPELMTSVSNGIGATTTATYNRINQNAPLYTKCPSTPSSYNCGTTYPTQSVDGPFYVVSNLSKTNDNGGTDSWGYTYGGLQMDLSGRGFLGFSQMTVTDAQTGIVSTTNYQMAFPYTGLPSTQTVVSGTTTLKSSTNTFTSSNEGSTSAGAAYYFVSLQENQASGADLDGSTLPSTNTSFTYDSYGNVSTKTVSIPSDGSSSTTTNSYTNDTTRWYLGQLMTTSVTNSVPSGSAGSDTVKPTGSLSASPGTIASGSSATLTWTSSNATSASISNGVGSVTPVSGGSVTVSPTTTTTYTLTLTNAAGTTTSTATVTIGPAPSGTFTASPATVSAGGSSTLTWTASNATSASINNGVGSVSASGGSTSVSPSTTTTYTITLVGPYGTQSYNTTVTVTPLPTGSLTASPASISTGGTSTLTWSSTGAASATLNGSSVATSGTTNVSPTSTTTYTLILTNTGGSTTYTSTVTVVPLPTGSLSASPTTVAPGVASTLTWTGSGAASASISPTVGTVSATGGSTNVSPTSTTTYTLTLTNSAGGTTTKTATVTVMALPTGSFSASPSAIPSGGTSTLSWSSSGATSATLNGSSIATSGTSNVSPTSNTTYTLVLTNAAGSTTYNTTVTIAPAPTGTLSASPTEIHVGGSSTLSWTGSNATSASISPTVGTVSPSSGSTSVSPTAATTYTLTLTGAGGTASPTASVSFYPPTGSLSENVGLGSTTLTWTSNADATSVTLNGGAVAASGSETVAPIHEKTFTLVVTGPGGTASYSQTVPADNN